VSGEPLDLDAIRQRALVRDRWVRGRIGEAVPWCRYCGVKLPGETTAAWEAVEHSPGCPVPDARSRFQPDFDALIAEIERLRG
jgi:hypothetical protein